MADKQEAPRAPSGRGITPLDIQQKEFRVSRFGGYRMRDVDEFLDELTSSLQATLAENERLRAQASAGRVGGTPDLGYGSGQADEIMQRARDGAGRIVADAKERAASAAGGTATAVTTDQERAAVNAFLAKEREFLQSLAALVQGHAESVKGMARAARSAVPAPAPPPDAQPAEAQPAEAKPTEGKRTEAKAAARAADPDATQAIAKPEAAAEPDQQDEPEATEPPDRTIRIDEPEPASAKN